MKILLLFSPHPNQRALAHKLERIVPIADIVLVDAPPSGKRKKGGIAANAASFVQAAGRFAAGLPLRKAWFGMLRHYADRYPEFPKRPSLVVADVNDPQVLDLVGRTRPQLVLVSGTNLLKQPLIEKIGEAGRIMNLHTGISPYIKGGPNCTNWCLSIRRFDLIGNTIMWLDAGIDSGNLVATERTPLRGGETLPDLHIKVMEHAHNLYGRCVAAFLRGEALPNVPQQSIGAGRLFLTRHWTPPAIARAVWNFKRHYRSEAAKAPPEELALVPAPETSAFSPA
jgi:methionyl-tRNA formyltransferase